MIAAARRRLRHYEAGWVALVILVALFVSLPALELRLLADDLFQRGYVDGLFGPKSPWSLYLFALDDPEATAAHTARGSLPWWTEPHFRFAHLRPLSSILVWIDHAVLPRDSAWGHVHSMLWMVAFLLAAAHALPRVVGRRLAWLILPAIALGEPMAWMVGWQANRCAIVSGTFGLLALALHVRRRRAWRPLPAQRRRDAAIEGVWWLLAFAAGEYALCLVAFAATWELAVARESYRTRLVAMVPAATAGLAFAITYLAIGCGVYGATTYVDPLSDSATFVAELAGRVARTAGETFLVVPGEIERFYPRFAWSGVPQRIFSGVEADVPARTLRHAWLSGAATAVVCTAAWWACRARLSTRERRGTATLVWGAMLALIPLAAIPPATRALAIPSLGGGALFAAVALACWRAWRSPRAGELPRRIALTLFAPLLALQHVGYDAVLMRRQLDELVEIQAIEHEFFFSEAVSAVDLGGRHVVVVAVPDLVTGIYGLAMTTTVDRPRPSTWHALAIGPRPHLLRTLDAHTIELSSVGAPMHAEYQETLFRAPRDALHEGDKVDVGIFRASVRKEKPGEGPISVVFRFDRRLDDPQLVFLEAGPNGLAPLTLPAKGRTHAIKPPWFPRGPR